VVDELQLPKFAELAADALREPFQNITRGLLAEALVARLVGGQLTKPWTWVDIVVDDHTLEVKSTGVQAWTAPTRRPPQLSFDIAAKSAWNGNTGRGSRRKRRWADLYVFAHIDTTERTRDAFMDMANWALYVVPTDVLDKRDRRSGKTAKSISLASVRRLSGRQPVQACELRAKVRAAMAELEPRPQPWPPLGST
jgi:hypothetical protein